MRGLKEKYINSPVQIRAAFWFLVCTIIQRSISIISTPIFTRLLTNEEYGKYSAFLSWMGILTCFVTMYIYSGIYPQAIVKFDKEKNQYSSAMQGLTLFLILGWLCIYLFFSSFWNRIFNLNTSQMLAMIVIMWSNAVFGFWSAEQRVAYRYKKLVIVTLIEAILQTLAGVLLILLTDDKVSGLVWGIALATISSYFMLFVSQMKRGKTFFSKKVWEYSLKLAVPLVPHYLSGILLNNFDRIMIRGMVGDGQAGIYNLAYTISMCGTLINQALLQTITPWMFQKIKAKQYSSIKAVAYPTLVLVAAVNIMFILFAPEVIKLFAPPSYYEAIWVIPPVAMSVYFMFMYNLFSNVEFFYEKTYYISTATMIGAVLNVALNYFGIKRFGYFAAGYTTLLCYIVFATLHYLFMQKICRGEKIEPLYDVKLLLAISVGFVACGPLLMTFYNSLLIRLFIALAILSVAIIKRDYLKKLYHKVKRIH